MPTRGLGLIIYGVEGIGKTSFACQFAGPLKCISVRETGFLDLLDVGDAPEDAEHYEAEDFQDLLDELKSSDDQGTVIVDSLSGVSQFMKDYILEHYYEGAKDDRMKKFAAFSEGWRIHAPILMERLENVCTKLRSEGVNIILIGHTKIEKSKNIISNDYQSAMLDMESWPRNVLTKWAQAVLFMSLDFSVRSSKKWKGKTTEAKVEEELDEEVDRVMFTSKHPSHSAKNRLKLPNPIPMGSSPAEAYQNFVSVLPPKFKESLNG